MKLEVGNKYKTVGGEIAVVKAYLRDRQRAYPFIVDIRGVEYSYSGEGFFINPRERHELDIIEEIKETKMKLEVGKKYRTVDGTIVTVEYRNEDSQYYPMIADDQGIKLSYTSDGFYHITKEYSDLNIVEEIQENTMFNKDYKYLFMDADGYNKASINKPTLNTEKTHWDNYDLLIQKGFFNLGDDWKESLREIVYNDDGSIYLRKPRHEFKVDDKVLVRGTGESEWKKRHFCKYIYNGLPMCYIAGQTSFTTSDASIWDEIKPYYEEE